VLGCQAVSLRIPVEIALMITIEYAPMSVPSLCRLGIDVYSSIGFAILIQSQAAAGNIGSLGEVPLQTRSSRHNLLPEAERIHTVLRLQLTSLRQNSALRILMPLGQYRGKTAFPSSCRIVSL
jgi:hypothetical protein